MRKMQVRVLVFASIFVLTTATTEIVTEESTLLPSTTLRQPEEQEVTQNNDYNAQDSTTLVFPSDNTELRDEPLSETKMRTPAAAQKSTKDIDPPLNENKKGEKDLEVVDVTTETPSTIPTSTRVSLKSLTQRQDDVLKELNDIWNYSASLNDTTHKELKTTLSSVVQLAYARVQTEPDDTLDRLKYLLQKLRQRIGVSEEQPPEREQHQTNISITDDQSSSKSHLPLLRTHHQDPTRHRNDGEITNFDVSASSVTVNKRQKRSYGLGTGIGEIESVPITSHENSIIANYNQAHDWLNNDGGSSSSNNNNYHIIRPGNSDNYQYNEDDEENPINSVTPGEKMVHKIIVVQDKGSSPVSFTNDKDKTKRPFFYLKSSTFPPLKTTAAPTFYPPIKLSYLDKVQTENQRKRPRPRPQHHTLNKTPTPTQTLFSVPVPTLTPGVKNKDKYKTPTVVTEPESLENILMSNENNDPVSVHQIANAIVKLLYPVTHSYNVPASANTQLDETTTATTTSSNSNENEPDNDIAAPNLRDKMQLLLTLSTAPATAPGKPNPQKLSLTSVMYHVTTTKPGFYPAYLQVHPLPSLSSSYHESLNSGQGISIKYPPVLHNLINKLKMNQSISHINAPIGISMGDDSHFYLEVPTQLPPTEAEQNDQSNYGLKTEEEASDSADTQETTNASNNADDRVYMKGPGEKASSEASALTGIAGASTMPSLAALTDLSSTVRSLNLTFPPININNNSYTYYYPAPPPPPTQATTTTTPAPTTPPPPPPSLTQTFLNYPTTNMTTSSSNQVMQIMQELQQSNIMHAPSYMINGTREGVIQFITTLGTLSYATKIVMVFALSVAVLSIILGVYSVAPPIVAVGILGVLIPIAILLLLQDSTHRRRYRNPHGKITITDLRDEFLLTIDLIERALEKFKKQHKIKRKKNKFRF